MAAPKTEKDDSWPPELPGLEDEDTQPMPVPEGYGGLLDKNSAELIAGFGEKPEVEVPYSYQRQLALEHASRLPLHNPEDVIAAAKKYEAFLAGTE